MATKNTQGGAAGEAKPAKAPKASKAPKEKPAKPAKPTPPAKPSAKAKAKPAKSSPIPDMLSGSKGHSTEMGNCQRCRKLRDLPVIHGNVNGYCVSCSHGFGEQNLHKLPPVPEVDDLQKAVGRVMWLLPAHCELVVTKTEATALAPPEGQTADVLRREGWEASGFDMGDRLDLIGKGFCRWTLKVGALDAK
jgi:hypothetical protein